MRFSSSGHLLSLWNTGLFLGEPMRKAPGGGASFRTQTKGGKRYGFPPLDTSFPF